MKGDRIYRRAAWAWLGVFLLGALGSNASANPHYVLQQEVEGWNLSAIQDDSGDYAFCSIDRRGNAMLLLSIMVERPSRRRYVTLSALDDETTFNTGTAYSVTYSIDQGAPVAVRAEAIGSRTVAIPLDEALAESLRRGNQVAFLARQGGAAKFDLSGSARALEALQDCVTRYLGIGEGAPASGAPSGSADARAATGNPFSSADAGPSSSEAGASTSTASLSETLEKTLETTTSPVVEAMLIGEVFLQEAHLAGYAEILDEQSPERIDGYDVTWILPKAKLGFAVVRDVAANSAEAMLDGMSEALQKACSNQARIERPDRVAPGILGRIRIYCGDAPPALFTLFNRPRGGMYLMTVKGDPGPEGRAISERYDSQISDALIRRGN